MSITLDMDCLYWYICINGVRLMKCETLVKAEATITDLNKRIEESKCK